MHTTSQCNVAKLIQYSTCAANAQVQCHQYIPCVAPDLILLHAAVHTPDTCSNTSHLSFCCKCMRNTCHCAVQCFVSQLWHNWPGARERAPLASTGLCCRTPLQQVRCIVLAAVPRTEAGDLQAAHFATTTTHMGPQR